MNQINNYSRHNLVRVFLWAICLSALTCAGYSRAASTEVTTNLPAVTNIVVLSEFDAASPKGKDPFFPRSTRRGLELSNSSSAAADPTMMLLQGISRGGNRPM